MPDHLLSGCADRQCAIGAHDGPDNGVRVAARNPGVPGLILRDGAYG
jgi:hypothetical protein